MRTSINHTTIVQALELCGGTIKNEHGRALNELALLLLKVPGHTLGDHPPEVHRIVPSIDALERAGVVAVERSKGRRVFQVSLTGKHQDHEVLDSEGPEVHAAMLIECLVRHGGKLEDPAGYASSLLINQMPDNASRKAWRHRIEAAVEAGWITREIKNSRTYSIELTEMGRKAAGILLNGAEFPVPVEPAPEPDPVPSDQPGVGVVEVDETEIDLDSEETLDPALAVLVEDDEVLDAVMVLLGKVAVGRQLHKLQAQIDQYAAEITHLKAQLNAVRADRDDLTRLLKIADDDIAHARREVAEAAARADKLGADRDQWRKSYHSLSDNLSVVSKAVEKLR